MDGKIISICTTIFTLITVISPIFTIIADAADTDYYISNSGDDSNSGTSPDQAWKTKSKLNTELASSGCINDGDDIYFNRGDIFDEDVYIGLRTTDGTASNPMIFGAYGTGADPIITASSSMNNPYFYFLNNNIGYWTFEHLTFRAPTSCGVDIFIGGNTGNKHNLVIHNCTFDGNNPGANSNRGRLLFYNMDTCTIENCSFIDASYYFYGDGAGNINCRNTIVKDCTINGEGGVQDNMQIHCEYADDSGNGPNHYMYNITSYNCQANAFDIVGGFEGNQKCENVYIKNCIGYDTGSFVIQIAHSSVNVTVEDCYFEKNGADIINIGRSNNTIIRNTVFKGTGNILGNDVQWNGGSFNFGWGLQDCTIYHCTFITNTGRFITTNTDHYTVENLSGFIFKNNIFYANNNPGIFLQYHNTDYGGGNVNLTNTDSDYSYNMWWRISGSFTGNLWQPDDDHDFFDFTEWSAQPEVYNDITSNPNLVNPTGSNYPDDFELDTDSPAINAGDWLTYAVGGGSGTKITVDDANYFFPGNDVFNIAGDNIFIGDETDLEITAIDYNAETITVDRSITWSDGEVVSLSSFYGSAPDIGAFESLISGPDESNPEISNVLLIESNPLDTDPTYGWINITSDVTADSGLSDVRLIIAYPDSSSVNVSMNEIESNNYYYNTSTILSNHGKYSYYIWANDTNGNQSTSTVYDFSMPPNWDINKDEQCTVLDLTLISNHYEETGQNGWLREDVDNNGIIQVLDFILVSNHYNEAW